MKKTILALLGIAVFSFAANGAVLSSANVGATNINLTTNPFTLQSLTLTSTNTSWSTVKLFDDDTAPLGSWTNTTYVSYATYSSNSVENYVGTTGVTNLITNTVMYTLAVTNSAATNALSPIWVGVVNLANPVSVPVDLRAGAGVSVSNTAAGLTITVLGVSGL